MGMDIHSSSGVVMPLEEAIPSMLRKAKKADALKAAEAVKEHMSV
jgi:hypothetical protein